MISAWRAEILARPWHVILAAATIGLAARGDVPAALLAAALALPLLTASAIPLALALAALGGGAAWADARIATLDRAPLAARAGHAASGEATLLESPRADARGWRATVSFAGDRALVRWHVPVSGLATGDVITVEGGLRALGPHDGWLVPRHVHSVLWADRVTATGARRGGASGVLDGVRRRALGALGTGLPPPQAGLLRGMVLGDDATLPDGARRELRRAGLGHLVAASGANVALLAVLVMAFGALLGVPLRPRLAAVILVIAAYVPLAGGGASIRRAGIMGGAAIAATLASRPAARWHALLLAAAATLAIDPASRADPGWQLSFAAVAAIAALSGPLRDVLVRRRCPPGLAEAIALTTAATIGTAPVSAARFGVVSLAALPANVLVAPVVAPITWLGMIAALVAQAAPAAATPFVVLASAPLACVTAIGHLAAGLPGAAVRVPVALVTLAALLAAGSVVWAPARRAARPLVVAAVFAAAIAGARAALRAPALRFAPGGTGVAFLDVGQGDATLLVDHGHAVLVDAGPPGGPVVRRLRDLGVRRLDARVTTHAQADHDGGAADVARALPVGAVLDGSDGVRDAGGRALALARRPVGRSIQPRAGQTIRAGAIVLHILWPGPGATVPGEDPNARAVVAVGSVGPLRVLLTADAESDVLAPLALPVVDVLKVSHHGSADAGLPGILTRVRPRLAVIEVGAHNTYGHPAPATLATLRAARVPTLRTDRDGTVIVQAQGRELRVQRHA